MGDVFVLKNALYEQQVYKKVIKVRIGRLLVGFGGFNPSWTVLDRIFNTEL